MKGIILYKSKYGATKKYANWLAEETGFPCAEVNKADFQQVKACDIIILGGGIYASGISGISFLKKNISSLNGKKIAVFCCGASPYDKKAFNEIKAYNLKGSLSDIPCYYCRGAWNMTSMSFKDRTLCNMLRKVVSKKSPDDYEVWEKALMEAGDNDCDWTDKNYLKPIIEFINQ